MAWGEGIDKSAVKMRDGEEASKVRCELVTMKTGYSLQTSEVKVVKWTKLARGDWSRGNEHNNGSISEQIFGREQGGGRDC